uniref:Superkiller viralicidic activity 2-like 2 n=1 Tax=Romanomermis culicivorax TaxID=13658 RepID=A0A915LC82_ROMCU
MDLSPTNGDHVSIAKTMADIEADKIVDAKTRAEGLLNCLKQGILNKRPAPEEPNDDEPCTSKAMLAHDAVPDAPDSKRQKLAVADSTISESDDLLNTFDSSNRIKIHTVETVDACLHEVAVPHNMEYQPLMTSNMKPAREYPFVLDPFQRESLLCLDNNQSVLVAAHTSAGKTVVALYAVAMCLRDKQRVIYTTPIKALSNQKYRELFEEYKDVGLMTGDVTINPSASVLVMTTEILRSMLYRGSEIMREVGWVIFDEIHYMRDKERGVVWEETIILLPDEVRYVFLSATIPNARQFAEWVCYLHKQPCHVVYTDYRPVPLQNYIYPAGGDGIYLVYQGGKFNKENFEKAMTLLREKVGEAGSHADKRGRKGGATSGDGSNVFKIIQMIMEREFSPVIIFSFSRRECEAYATDLSKLDFNTEDEKKLIQEVFENALEVLSDEDRNLPQIVSLLPILKRGIGIHHSGLLPILKETIEILFSEGLIKALFATETFSMGLNMPAKTVLFTSAKKFDGKETRFISSGEYIQMSGRAGRRGLDEKGIAILIVDQQISSEAVTQIVKGLPDPLNSQFRLTYNMVLNLLRVEGINPEFMLERSFFQFQNYSMLPNLVAKATEAREKYQAIKVVKETEVVGYYNIKKEIESLGKRMNQIITKPTHIVPFLQPGRLIHVVNENDDFGWGMIVDYEKKVDKKDPINVEPIYIVNALLNVSLDSLSKSFAGASTLNPKPCLSGKSGQMEVVPIALSTIYEISSVRIYFQSDLRPLNNRQAVYHSIQEVKKRFPNNANLIPLLDPIEDMKIKDDSLKGIIEKIKLYEKRYREHPLRNDPQLKKICEIYEQKLQAEREKKLADDELVKAHKLLQLEELKCRKRVLRRLGYADHQDVITVKGRVACEISAADELLLTEMLFAGAFNGLSSQQCVALLSCFVFQEKAEFPKLADDLSGLLRQMQETARYIAKVTKECKLPIEEDAYVEGFKPHLMDVVHAWCNGATFSDLLKMTQVFEGTLFHCFNLPQQ